MLWRSLVTFEAFFIDYPTVQVLLTASLEGYWLVQLCRKRFAPACA